MSDDPSYQAMAPGDLRNQIMSSLVPKTEREHWVKRRIEELERKLLLARKGLFWIQVRAACDAGEPLADKIVAVATDHLSETKDPALPEIAEPK